MEEKLHHRGRDTDMNDRAERPQGKAWRWMRMTAEPRIEEGARIAIPYPLNENALEGIRSEAESGLRREHSK